MEAFFVQLEEIIERVGWAIQGVFPVKADEIAFAYTVGLAPKAPELMMRGLPIPVMHHLLNQLAVLALQDALVIGERLEDAVQAQKGVPLPIIVVPSSQAVPKEDWGVANRRNREQQGLNDFSRMSVLWSDIDGHLPTEEGVDEFVAELQRPW